MPEPAPFFSEAADGPDGSRAWWLTAGDGVRLRIGLWRPEGAAGTVLLFPGRTEYVEKYGRTARDLAQRGLATLVVDWRGQGLADRLTGNPMIGHVRHFTDYQHDGAAMVAAARELDLPRPWHLLGHSMGGCIGLRAAMEGMPVASCVFTGPMWGIRLANTLRPLAWALSWSGKQLGMGHCHAPGTGRDSYVLTEPFATNMLTRDREMHNYMTGQLKAHPELALGGPSLRWLHEALRETRALARRPAPAVPCLTVIGSDEEIVDVPRIEERMRDWPGGQLEVIPGGRHEVLMEDPETRTAVINMVCGFYARAAGAAPQAEIPVRAGAAAQ